MPAIVAQISTVDAADRLTMPFACEARRGRVHLTPAPDTTYGIGGLHEQQPVTACAANEPGLCRTWMAHKFELDCNGTRVTWLNVVGAMVQQRPWRGYLAEGQLYVRMGPRWAAAGFAPECAPSGPSASSTASAASSLKPAPGTQVRRDLRQRPFAMQCSPRSLRHAVGAVPMPPGFAPVLGTGARFGNGAVTLAKAPASTSPTAPATAGPAVEPPMKADQGDMAGTWATTTTLPAPSPAALRTSRSSAVEADAQRLSPSVLQTALAAETLASATAALDAIPANAAGTVKLLAGLALLFGSLGGWLAWCRLRPISGPEPILRPDEVSQGADAKAGSAAHAPTRHPPIDAHAPDDAAAAASAAMIRSADALQTVVRAQIMRLANPRQQTEFLADLSRIQACLLDRQLVEQVADRDWVPVQVVLARVLGDLEALQSALDTIHADHILARQSWAMPANRMEAFETLGVNPDADEKIVKKIVDALRQSWHPDHAKDERDRNLREHRIKALNVAWDLIRATRQEAA